MFCPQPRKRSRIKLPSIGKVKIRESRVNVLDSIRSVHRTSKPTVATAATHDAANDPSSHRSRTKNVRQGQTDVKGQSRKQSKLPDISAPQLTTAKASDTSKLKSTSHTTSRLPELNDPMVSRSHQCGMFDNLNRDDVRR